MLSDNSLHKILKELKISMPESILRMALTHSSLTFEKKEMENYERLEFIGDSVLKLVISDILYKAFPNYTEGRMTKIRSILVSDNMLFELSKKIELNKLILLSKNEEKDGGRLKQSVVACAFEAVLGAIYLTNGLDKAIKYIRIIYDKLHQEIDNNLDSYNAKALLQEHTQKIGKDLPKYIETTSNGNAQSKKFTFSIYYKDDFLSEGTGNTKREAQQNAAKKACIHLGLLKGVGDEK